MIEFANNDTAPLVRTMWKTCFGDSEEFMNLYFSKKYKDENTLIYLDKGEVVASLQMLPYKIRFYGEIIPVYYLAGLCTLPLFRNKGIMGQLIKEAFAVMQKRQIPLSILIPAEEWLFGYYAKFGFETTFEKGEQLINLKKILEDNRNDLMDAYREFDLLYQNEDFCVLKDEKNFQYIMQDNALDGYPLKSNLTGMSAIVDTEYLLNLYAKKHKNSNFNIKLHEVLSGGVSYYTIINGNVKKSTPTINTPVIEVTSQELVRLLFGFKINELSSEYFSMFDKHNPVMNLMLE